MNDPIEIQNRIKELEGVKRSIERRYDSDIEYINKQIRAIQKDCPHIHMNGGQYTRWCLDCGQDWDTT